MLRVDIPGVTVGNAREDAAPFRHWLVGDLAEWSALGAPARERFGLRDTRQVAIKWGVHGTGELRPGGWADGDEFVTLSVLVSGDFVLTFDDGSGGAREVRLSRPGDYALWAPGTRHTWRVAVECVVLTVRWRDS
jgi:uncharacterized cupin superfamily protein